MVDKLYEVTNAAVPAPLANLKNKKIDSIMFAIKKNMSEMVFKLLDL